MNEDEKYMRVALRLAERGLGMTAPNPSVGCVIVKDGRIVGRGWTAAGGRPHAETVALERAGGNVHGTTAYVTLEPCCHHGQTPPCTDALITAGVKRVVVATLDPYEEVKGRGIELLRQAGIEVTVGVCEDEACRINEGSFKVIECGRPFVTLKLAVTVDGKLVTPEGQPNWFTCAEARDYAHLLRYRHDAIMVGVNTVLADNPRLTCRLPGLEWASPVRVVMDSNGRLLSEENQNLNIFNREGEGTPPTYIVASHSAASEASEQNPGVYLLDPALNCLKQFPQDDWSNLSSTLNILAEKNITRLLVEGGGELAESFLKERLVDRFILIHSPDTEGDRNAPDITEKFRQYIKNFSPPKTRQLGKDKCFIYDSL